MALNNYTWLKLEVVLLVCVGNTVLVVGTEVCALGLEERLCVGEFVATVGLFVGLTVDAVG
jgi:hypothetical protein